LKTRVGMRFQTLSYYYHKEDKKYYLSHKNSFLRDYELKPVL
jgi:hypothetical protein